MSYSPDLYQQVILDHNRRFWMAQNINGSKNLAQIFYVRKNIGKRNHVRMAVLSNKILCCFFGKVSMNHSMSCRLRI